MVNSVVMGASLAKLRERHETLAAVVMAGLVPAIHVFLAAAKKDVDARDKPGHDVERAEHALGMTRIRRHFLVLPESFTASKVANSTL